MKLFTKNPRYAVVYNGWIFYSYIFPTIIIEYDKTLTEYQVEVNENYHYTKLTINPELPIPANRNIVRIDDSQTVPPEGQYQLYKTFKLGSVEYITSRILYENMFCIYYVSEDKVAYDQIKKMSSKLVTNNNRPVKYNIGDYTYMFLLRAGYMPERDQKTGEIIEQKHSNQELTEFLRRSNLLYPLDIVTEHANYSFIMLNGGVNKNNSYNSADTTVYGDQMEDVYLDGLNYANQVINTLQAAYPEVNFFVTPKDWNKDSSYKDIKGEDGKDYKEWCRYKIGYEDYTQARRDFFNSFGPVALHTKLRIEFEYAALDTSTFRRRRTDLFLDQFISYYSRDDVKLDADLLGDNTKQVGFSIHWIKDEAMEGETVTQKGTSMLDTVDLDLHTMRFQCELRINILRFCKKLPPILQTVFDITSDNEKNYHNEHKATEEEQRIILEVYEKGGTLRDGDIYNLKDSQKREAIKQNMSGEIVEFTDGHEALQYNEDEM